MKIRPAWIAISASALVVGGVFSIGVTQSGSHRPSAPSAAGQVVAEPSVAEALTAKGCMFLTKPGDNDAEHTVVLVSRTGVMSDASLPTSVLTALSSTRGGSGKPVGTLTLITVGGGGEQPRIVLNRAALTDPKAGTARAQRLMNKLPECVNTALDATAGPKHAGSDELLAEQVAAQASEHRLVVVSDGEANAGLLDLRNQNYPQGDPAAAVARVTAARQLPKFAGVKVTYFGIGQNRTEAERSWLTTFYRDLCTSAGGACTVEKDLVPVSETARAVPDDPPLKAVTAIASGPKTIYRVDAAAFAANSTNIVDQDAVSDALRSIAAAARQAGAVRITVTGHACADGSPRSELQQISEQRASKIAALLRELGVTTMIETTGRAADVPIRGPEANGTYTLAQCAVNRRVDIVVD